MSHTNTEREKTNVEKCEQLVNLSEGYMGVQHTNHLNFSTGLKLHQNEKLKTRE